MTAGTPTSREEAPRRRRAGALPGPIRVTLSDRAEDVDDALRVIHHGFVSAGYMEPRPSGRRMHPSYLNPDTRFAVARVGDHLAGTVAMVNDGPFGLPCERSFAEEVDDLRATGPVREVGSLVVDARWRRHTRHIYMHLLATLVRMALEGHPRQIYVLAVTPENARFTSGLFGCETMGEPRPLYGAPAVLLRTSHDRLRE